MIETIKLTRKYGELVALDNLDLKVESGSCFGFIGPNGAGKTTTIRILATLLKPTWGEARIDGLTVGYQNALIRPIIGYVPDFIGTYDDMLVSEYLEFFAACYNLHGSKRRQVVADVLDLTDLHHKVNAQVAGLSRGMSQRLSIARVLLHDPRVLLMDEPASGLDPRARVEIRELLRELRRIGKTILISSHILSELAELCDSVGIIEQGKLLFAGPTSEAIRRADHGLQYEVIVSDRAREAGQFLSELRGVKKVTLTPRGDTKVLIVELGGLQEIDPSEVPARLITAGYRLVEFKRGEVDLETAFMRLTDGIVN